MTVCIVVSWHLFYPFFLVPPTFVESPKNQTIPKGHTASFPCTALGDPRPSITWYKSHDLITSNARYHILANQTLVIFSVTAQDSGSLTCRAMNEAGTREAKAYLLVAGLAFYFLIFLIKSSHYLFILPWEWCHDDTETSRAGGLDSRKGIHLKNLWSFVIMLICRDYYRFHSRFL